MVAGLCFVDLIYGLVFVLLAGFGIVMAAAALAVNPQFSPAAKRRMRSVALVALVIFAAFFVLSYVMCVLSAGSLEFWHAWSWFSA